MESVIDAARPKVKSGRPGPLDLRPPPRVEELRQSLRDYFRAWRLPEAWQEELLAETMWAVRDDLARDPAGDLRELAFEKAERAIQERLNEVLRGARENEGPLSPEERLALLCAGPLTERDAASELRAAFTSAVRLLDSAKAPARPPETHLAGMETSLTRLPSIRMVTGWIVLIVLLFLAFVFTR